MKKIKIGIGHYILAENVKNMRIFECKKEEDKGKAQIAFTMIGDKENDKPVFSDKFDGNGAAEAFIENM